MKNTVLAGRYTLQELIGHGGEAQVWQARDNQTGLDVAIRLPRQRLLQPLSAALPARHPGWIVCLEIGRDPEQGAFQVLELVRGETLAEQIQRHPLAWDDWLRFLTQSIEAVAELHRRDSVHGDLQASNFLYNENARHWLLLELPSLRFPSPPRSGLFGSLPVLAPELFAGQPPSFRSDLYALGILYFYALTGNYPHTGTAVEIAAAHLREPIPPLGTGNARVSPELNGWFQRLLARAPEERFSDAKAAYEMLVSCISSLR